MKTLKIISMLVLLLSFMACKKEKSSGSKVCKNASSYTDSQGTFYQFAYDLGNKLTEIKSSNNNISFAYENNDRTITLSDNYSIRTIKIGAEDNEIIELNQTILSNGEVKKTTYQRIKTALGFDVTGTTLNFRKNENVPYQTVKQLYKIAVTNGNLTSVRIIDLDNNNREIGSINYSYNISRNLSDYQFFYYTDLVDGIPFLSKNLIIRNAVYDNVNNINTSTVFYFDFDEHDRITNLEQTYSVKTGAEENTAIIKSKFEYKCN